MAVPAIALADATLPDAGTTMVVEGGATDSYGLSLNSEPLHPVTIRLQTGRQLRVSPAFIRLTADNWADRQYVQVEAIDDNIVEGSHIASIVHQVRSRDRSYDGLQVADAEVTISDNDRGEGITIDAPLIGAAISAGEHEVRASARDVNGVAGIAISFDGSGVHHIDLPGAEQAGEATWALLVPDDGSLDGEHEIQATATDAGGQLHTTTQALHIDTQLPSAVNVTAITTPGDAGLVRMDVAADDAQGLAAIVLLAGSVELDKRRADATPFEGSMHVAASAFAGTSNLRVVAIDHAGNMRATRSFTLDDVAAGSGPGRAAVPPMPASDDEADPAFTAPPAPDVPEDDAGVVISPGGEAPVGSNATIVDESVTADAGDVSPADADTDDDAATDASRRAPPIRAP